VVEPKTGLLKGKAMLNSIYQFLEKLGYSHPIHPTEVHMPIGLVVGALVFALLAVIFHRERLRWTPRHCIILAFIWIFPTMLFGIMDWQHFYGGAFLLPIKVKLILAPILAVLLFAAILLARKYGATSRLVVPVYFLCFFCVVVLGYFGGQLVYGGKTTTAPEAFKEGEMVFASDCSVCHPHGGNAIDPRKPILHSPKIEGLDTFLTWVRHPTAPMPPFEASKISDAQVGELYAYIMNVLERPKKE
jgi:uncharacterized membrane protein